MPPLIGDEAWRSRERVRRRRGWLLQAAFVAVLAVLFALLARNVAHNLEARQIRTGFGFLAAPAGFEIGESPVAYEPRDSYLQAFGVGVLNTLRVAAASVLLATLAGVVVGLARLARHPMVRTLATGWVELSRNVPLLIQLLVLYLVFTELFPDPYEPWRLGGLALFSKQGLQVAAPVQVAQALLAGLVLAALLAPLAVGVVRRRAAQAGGVGVLAAAGLAGAGVGLSLGWLGAGVVGGWSVPELEGLAIVGGAALTPEFLTLWLALSFFTSGAIAEIVRAGAEAVPLGQWQAAQALGLTRPQAVSAVIFPQALRLAIPPLASQYMNLIKNSSLAVAIGYPDVVSIANTAINQNGQTLECLALIMAVYLAINLVVAVLMNRLNARVTRAPR